MDQATATTSKCARCGDPATLECAGCKAEDPAPGELVAKIQYCSVSCQKGDWPRHKTFCKATQAISKYRSAVLQTRKLGMSQLQTHEHQTPKPQGSEPQGDEVKIPKEQNGQTETLALLPDNSAHSCAECQSPATKACKGCKAAPNATQGLVQTTCYCSQACQTANWSTHKKTCLAAQARRSLYKAGEELQKRYYWYCRAMVMVMVETDTLDGGYDILYEKDSITRTTNATTLLQEMRSNREEERIYMTCLIGSAHTGAMGNSVREYLKDLVTNIHEVNISMKTLRRRFIREDQLAISNRHQVLHIFMKNGEEYALDATGVQFGLKNPIVPWTQYLQEHVHQIESSKVFD